MLHALQPDCSARSVLPQPGTRTSSRFVNPSFNEFVPCFIIPFRPRHDPSHECKTRDGEAFAKKRSSIVKNRETHNT